MLVVGDVNEKQPFGGRGRARACAIARGEHLADRIDGTTAAADLHQRADDVADHVTEEAVAGDLVLNQLSTTEDTGDTEERTCLSLCDLRALRGGDLPGTNYLRRKYF